MRVFKALIISLLVYALFIWLYVTYFSFIAKSPLQARNHVIKIDIRDIPAPKPAKVVAPVVKSKVSMVKKVEKKPIVNKPVVKKKPKKRVVKKKKIIKKKVLKKKKVIKKKPVKKKKFVKKKIFKKKVIIKKPIEIEPIFIEELIIEETYTLEPIFEEKSEALQQFESEMVYIPELMLAPHQVNPQPVSPWSYPSNKIRKLYGASYHEFTERQKEFIKNNLETIQQITQRTLTQRGYPEGAGRTGQEGTNVVSFNLHPNGDISDLRLKTRIGYSSLDNNTLSLIRVAYMDYPYPSTTTKIIFYVIYSIY